VGRLGALILDKYPALRGHIPMLSDKGPIVWKKDSPRLVTNKLFHYFTANRVPLAALKGMVYWLERIRPNSTFLVLLYRWASSAHICRGYRQGLRDFRHAWNPHSYPNNSVDSRHSRA
jgi:hypothetical protein